MRIFSLIFLCAVLVSCDRTDNETLAEAEADGAREAAEAGKLDCALAGEQRFSRQCEMERLAGPDGVMLIIRHPDGGFRRFEVLSDGRGLIPADGAEPARIALLGDRRIEVSIGDDRYRLPARIKGEE